jgi:predicted phosphodiesterase
MLPPDFQSSTGHTIKQTRGQAYTWECWLDMIAWATKESIHAVVIVGDVVDGKQFKSHGSELCLPLIVDQEEASEAILTPLLSATKCPVYFVKGTFYHDDEAGRSVDNVAKALKGTIYEGLGSGTYAKSVLDLNVDGVICDFSHGISVSGGLYRAVAIDREGLWSKLASKEDETPEADVIVRGHAHYFIHTEHTSTHSLILPAWQLQTDFMRKNSRYRMIPDIGAVILKIDGDAKKRGDDPCQVRKRIYRLPKPNLTHLREKSGTK